MATKLLPRFYSTKELPSKSGLVPISPQQASRPFEAMSQAGEKIEGLGLRAANVFDQIKERERIASDALQAVELDNTLKNESLGIADKFKGRTDYENFDKDIENEITSLRGRISPKEPSPALNLAFEKGFNQEAFHLRNTIKAKKYDVMNKRGKIAFGAILDRAYQDYADTDDPTKRKIIKNELEIQGEILRGKNPIDPLWIDDKLRTFEKSAKTVASDLADVKADKAIMANPGQAYINLQDSKYLPDLLPKQRQDKIEKANAAFRIFGNEQEKKLKEQQKLAHDDEDRQVGDLFMKGEYTQAYSLAQQSRYLTGDEKRTWATSIESASKVKEDEIDPVIEGSNYAFVNELISKEVNPKTIRNYIMSYEFTKGTRQKLLDRLDTEQDKSINKSKSRAYDYMKGQIMPYGGMLAEVPPLQSANYTKAMNALDDWVDKQRKADKPITPKDIQMKSEELAITFQTTIAERQDFTAKENKEYFESLKKGKEKKVEVQPIQKKEYKTIQEVQYDYKSGKLTYDEAAQILRTKFKVK